MSIPNFDPNKLEYTYWNYLPNEPRKEALRSMNFKYGDKDYTFIPEDVITRGIKVGNNQYYYDWFLKEGNLENLMKDALPVDLAGVSWYGDWLRDKTGRSTSGILVPTEKTSFADAPVYADVSNYGGGITGLAKKDGQYVYTTNRMAGYIDETNRNYWKEYKHRGFLADLARDLTDSGFLPVALALLSGGAGASLGASLLPSASAATQSLVGNAVLQGAMSELQGGDFIKGAALGAAGSLAGGVQSGVADALGGGAFKNIASGALIGGTMAELSGGDFAKGALLGGVQSGINQAKLSVAEDYLRSLPSGYGDFPAPTEQDVLDYIAAESPTVTISDTTFKPDYSLSTGAPVIPEMGAQGVQVPTINEVIDVIGGVDYSLPTPSSGLGLVMPTAPNLESMGGAQGITVPVSGGTLTETGVIPTDYVPVLGDPNSFINQPPPDSGVKIEEPAPAQPEDISKKLAALDAAKALAPLAVGALTAETLVNKISDGQTQTGFPIVPIPSTWKSPEYDMAFMPSTPIDFGSSALLRGTQWETPVNLSALINTLNQPIISPETFQMMTQFQAPETPYETGITDIIGEIGGKPVSIADIISGIQSGQNYSS